MEKIILSKRVAVAIEEALKLHQENKELILKKHCAICFYDYEDWTGDNFQYLNELSLEQMAIALYVGYEVEKTPEEKLLKYFSSLADMCNQTNDEVYLGKMVTTKHVLNVLGIKIEGINC